MMETKEMRLDEYLEDIPMKFTVTEMENYSKEWDSKTFRAFRVTITKNKERVGVTFYQGRGIDREPTLADVIASLALDSVYADYTLREFGGEFGWNEYTASTHRACKKNARRLEKLFQGSMLEQVQELASQY
jgi:hypothetical protein